MPLLDRCIFAATSAGTGDFVESAAAAGFQTMEAAGASNGATYSYAAQSADLSQWEVGIGTYTLSTTTLARTTVLFNSLGTTAKISFNAAPQVMLTALDRDITTINAAYVPGGISGQVLYSDANHILQQYAITGSGNVVLSTGATLTLPNATGLPISTGLSGAGTGVLTALGVNIGTAGAFVVNGGTLGTPSSGTLTNATGLPISGIASLGTGVGVALGNAVNASGGLTTFGTDLPLAGGTLSGALTNTHASPQIILGVNTSVGAGIQMFGASSGNLTLIPAAAAGSSVTVTIPGATDTLVNLAGSQTLTNKTLAFASNTLTGVAPLASPTFTGTVTLPDGGALASSANNFAAAVTVTGASFGLTGNISAAAWTTSGIRYVNAAATLTDTSSSGTVATAYTDVWGGNTIAASSAAVFTNYYGAYFKVPVAGTNVTLTNAWALGADSLNVATKIGLPDGGTATSAGLNNIVAVGLGAAAPTTGFATTQAIGNTSTDGLLLANVTAATSGNQKWSPRLHYEGAGYGTTGAASQRVDFITEVQPVQGTAAPTANMVTSYSVNAGAYTSIFTVSSAGLWTIGGTSFSNNYGIVTGGGINVGGGAAATVAGGALSIYNSSNLVNQINAVGFSTFSGGVFSWSSGSASNTGVDTYLTRAAAATIQLGAANAASPVAQTLQVQSVVAGTSNAAGVNWTLNGSLSTGSGASGNMIFRVGGTGAAATSANALLTGLTIYGATATTGNPSVVLGNAALATNATDGFLYVSSGAGTPTGAPTSQNSGTAIPLYIDTTNSQLWLYLGGAWKQPKTPAGAALVTWQ